VARAQTHGAAAAFSPRGSCWVHHLLVARARLPAGQRGIDVLREQPRS
jgi:hypothetical protein